MGLGTVVKLFQLIFYYRRMGSEHVKWRLGLGLI